MTQLLQLTHNSEVSPDLSNLLCNANCCFLFTGANNLCLLHKCNSDRQQHPTNWYHSTCSSDHTTSRSHLNACNLQQQCNQYITSHLHLHLSHDNHHLITAAHKVAWSHVTSCWDNNFSCDVCLFVRALQSLTGACDVCSHLWCVGLKV